MEDKNRDRYHRIIGLFTPDEIVERIRKVYPPEAWNDDGKLQYEYAIGIATFLVANIFGHIIRDNGGAYMEHTQEVATPFAEDPEKKLDAYMHDFIEDSIWTVLMLNRLGFSKSVLDSTLAISRRVRITKDNKIVKEPYFEFICRLGMDLNAPEVKDADLLNNTLFARDPAFVNQDKLLRYNIAYKYLLAIQNNKIKRGTSVEDFVLNHPVLCKDENILRLVRENIRNPEYDAADPLPEWNPAEHTYEYKITMPEDYTGKDSSGQHIGLFAPEEIAGRVREVYPAEAWDEKNKIKPNYGIGLATLVAANTFGHVMLDDGTPCIPYLQDVATPFIRKPRKKIISYLHKMLSDSAWQTTDLRQVGFPQSIVHSVIALTRNYSELNSPAKSSPGRAVAICSATIELYRNSKDINLLNAIYLATAAIKQIGQEEPYLEYIRRCGENLDAAMVKYIALKKGGILNFKPKDMDFDRVQLRNIARYYLFALVRKKINPGTPVQQYTESDPDKFDSPKIKYLVAINSLYRRLPLLVRHYAQALPDVS